jgi:hypothetical protein
MPSQDRQDSTPTPPSEAIAEAIRAIVREELKHPAPVKQPSPAEDPSWQDAFWLLILIANVIFVVGLVPETWWKSPFLDIPSKVLPWIGGGTFVLGVTWFRERLVKFSRQRKFKAVMGVAFVPLLVLHIPFVTLYPRVDPPDSHLYVDDKPKEGPFQGNKKISLKLRSHTFKIEPHDAGSTVGRPIEWGWGSLLAAWLTNRNPKWVLIYPLTITSDGPGCTIRIGKSDSKEPLDTDFHDDALKKVANSWEFLPRKNSSRIDLPMGEYHIEVDKQGCDRWVYPTPVKVPSPSAVDLGPMTCHTP